MPSPPDHSVALRVLVRYRFVWLLGAGTRNSRQTPCSPRRLPGRTNIRRSAQPGRRCRRLARSCFGDSRKTASENRFQSSLAHHANLGLRQALASVKSCTGKIFRPSTPRSTAPTACSGNRGGVSHHLPRRDKTLNCSKIQSSGFGDGRVTSPAARATIARIPLAELLEGARPELPSESLEGSEPEDHRHDPLPATPALSQPSTASRWSATNPEQVMKMRPRHSRLCVIQHKKKAVKRG